MSFSNCSGPVWRSQTTEPFSWSPGMKSPRSATIRSCLPSLSRSTISECAGFGMLAITRSAPGERSGSPSITTPWPMSQATTSGRASLSRSKRRTLAVTGVRVSPGGLKLVRLRRSPPSPSGHGSGNGSVIGARASK